MVRSEIHSRKLCIVTPVILAIALAGLCSCEQEAAPRSDSDARVRFYKARLGGRGTYPAYARLGAAYIQKGRETGRQGYYEEAVHYLLTSLRYQRNYEALLWLASAQLARHEFREALAYAQEATETMPADLSARGTLFDAHLALGDFQRAEAVAEKMRTLKMGSAYYARLATLREYRGDLSGALEAMEKTCSLLDGRTTPVETRAWCQVRLGSLLVTRCEADKAEAAYRRALKLLPNYHRALEHIAELRMAQGRHDEAIAVYEKVLQATGDPTYRMILADIYDEKRDGRAADAERKRAMTELRQLAKSGSRAYLRPLVLLLVDQKESVAESLYWARTDWENRRDAYAADTLAWSHYQNGNTTEALDIIKEALRPGLKENTILFHAAMIHLRAGQHAQARNLVEQALACPLAFRPADRAGAEKLRAELQMRLTK